MSDLNARAERFIDLFLADPERHVTRAAIGAGYSERTAAAQGSRLLKSVKVQQEIKHRTAEIKQKLNVQAEDVVKLIWNQATANPNELIEIHRGACRYCYGDSNRYQRTPAEYQRDLESYLRENAALAAKGRADPDPLGLSFPVLGGTGFRRKREPNADCPECEGDGVMYEYVKDTRKLSPAGLALFAGVKITKDGIELKTNSQDKARELIGRHKGLFADLERGGGDDNAPAPVAITFEVKSARKPE